LGGLGDCLAVGISEGILGAFNHRKDFIGIYSRQGEDIGRQVKISFASVGLHIIDEGPCLINIIDMLKIP